MQHQNEEVEQGGIWIWIINLGSQLDYFIHKL